MNRETTARALGTTVAGLDAIEHTGLGDCGGPSPGRIGDRVADIEAQLEFALADKDWVQVADVLSELATLRLALDSLSFVDIHTATRGVPA
jgi:hypothetical protein